MDMNSLQQFAQVYSAFERKAEYERELRLYDNKPGMQRLMSRRPTDPLGGYSVEELRELLPYSLEYSVPELAFHHISDEGNHVKASFALVGVEGGRSRLAARLLDSGGNRFSEEHFELEPGEGFVHGYSRNPSGKEYARRLAYSHRQNDLGGFAKEYYRSLDAFCTHPLVVDLALGKLVALDREVVDSVRSRMAADKEQTIWREAELTRLWQSASDIRSVRGLASVRFKELSTRGIHARCDEKEKLFKALSNGIYARCVREADAEALYNEARFAESVKRGSRPLGELLAVSIAEAGALLEDRRSGKYHKKVIEAFVMNALDNGYAIRDIDSEVKRYMQSKELGGDFRPAYDTIVTKQAGMYVAIALEQTDTAYGKGLRDSAKIEIQSPQGTFEQRMTEVSDFKRANGVLVLENQHASHEIRSGGAVSHESARALGSALARSGVCSSPEAIARLCGIAEDAGVRSGYYTAMTEMIREAAPQLGRSGVLAVDVLAKDIALTAATLAVKEPVLAAQLLEEAGVVLTPGGLAGGIVAAAAALHADGGILASRRVSEFRQRWEEYIRQTRLSGEKVRREVKQSMGLTQKKKLF